MSDLFKTISSESEAKVTEKMSRFLAFAAPVRQVGEAKDFVASKARAFHDARHVCWAYMVGPERSVFMSNDDGEPSGTAGKPILGQINSFGLTNIVIVVVRYFGGIKLGTSGLIAAYRTAARQVIENAVVVECHAQKQVSVSFDYLAMNGVMKQTKQPGIKIVNQSFDNECSLDFLIEADRCDTVVEALKKIDGVLIDGVADVL